MVEHRIDGMESSDAIAFTRAAAAERQKSGNYDARGRQLLPLISDAT